ncbi:16S rRNA (adenine(1518)-N(6)/adenine(1519)-N(6))-dimethyltransferase RsmA [Brachybacterium sp. GCM10030267]|uniref:16S rRNA (adenine(1518)-N(6)/adenine(1519)-N(6))- dimethyltransferase RsmA n=1 Tax=unclassified Brachybacterium TaxID=2623841 RepID=UPI00361A1305
MSTRAPRSAHEPVGEPADGAVAADDAARSDDVAPADGAAGGDLLLTGRDIRELAEAAGIRPSKQRGQNFVMDPNTVRTIVARAGTGAGQAVLEVGPGLGSLTLGLLESGADVVAIELDRGLAELLPLTLRARGVDEERYRLVHADALRVTELPSLPRTGTPSTLVANLPYNVATPILLTAFERFDSLRTALVMVQSEVVDRLTAGPGSRVYGGPSVKTAWYGRAVHAGRISRQVFWPVPNVDSALVELVRHDHPLGTAAERDRVFAIVDAAFAQRRKTLRAALAGWAGGPARSEQILRAAGIDPGARGETLGIDEFRAIARASEEAA